MSILIKNSTLVSMDETKDKIQENMDILIEGKNITKIGKNLNDSAEKVIDAKGKVVMPGLINTHTHVPMSIFRETLDGYTLQDWLNKKIWPMEAKLTEDDIYWSSLLSFLEMVKTGCTTINDMYFITDSIIKSETEVGIRLQTTRTLMGIGPNTDADERLDDLNNLLEKHKNNDLVTFNAGIHGLYTTDKQNLDKFIEFARDKNLRIHMHFCENSGEVEDIKKLYNKKPVEVLRDEFGGCKLILAHCVKLTNEDIDEIYKINDNDRISISTCPVSNLRLGCGIAKLSKMQDVGINVSIGTDGQGSGSNLDIFESMSYASLIQKGINENPDAIPSYEVLKMATINGAKALGLEKEIGSIEVGKKADLIIVDTNECTMKPTNNLISELVYNTRGSNVDTTICNGKILMENRKTSIDEDMVFSKNEEIIDRIKE